MGNLTRFLNDLLAKVAVPAVMNVIFFADMGRMNRDATRTLSGASWPTSRNHEPRVPHRKDTALTGC